MNEHALKEEGPNTIKLNFTKALSASDWTNLPAKIVYNEIEPIAREHKL